MDVGVEEASRKKEEVPTWGKSLPVESVQEIVRRDPSVVPERYIRENEDRPTVTDVSFVSSETPVIDLALLSTGEEDELKKLDMACRRWGFFQIINHGVAEELRQKIKDAVNEFFKLPLDQKKKYSMPSDDIQGYGQPYVVSEEQKLDWADALILSIYPLKMRKEGYWPKTPSGFKDILEAYSAEVNRVAIELLACLSSLMCMDNSLLLRLHGEMMQALRVNYYPPCCSPDQVLGLSPHSDSNSITILLQDDDVPGLQIRHDSMWMPVKPKPNALVVNIGDSLEDLLRLHLEVTEMASMCTFAVASSRAWPKDERHLLGSQFQEPVITIERKILSNGNYKSIEHRAVTNKEKARISIVSFVCPADDAEIGPLDHILHCQQQRPNYNTIRYGDYVRYGLTRKLEGKAHTEFAKLENK